MNTGRILMLLSAAGLDIEVYLENPHNYSSEYFESVHDAILEAIGLIKEEEVRP